MYSFSREGGVRASVSVLQQQAVRERIPGPSCPSPITQGFLVRGHAACALNRLFQQKRLAIYPSSAGNDGDLPDLSSSGRARLGPEKLTVTCLSGFVQLQKLTLQ